MKLHDSLDDAVADVSADLPALAVASRNQGLSIGRRRRALAAVGSVAAATVLAVGAYALVPGSDSPDDSTGTEVASAPTTPLSGRTAPITGRGTVAALMAAVGNVTDGSYSWLQGTDHQPLGETLASFQFLPDSGAGPAGLVMVIMQRYTPSQDPTTPGCEPDMRDCAVRRLPGSDFLRTYSNSDSSESGRAYERRVAEVLSPERRLRLVLSAANTNQDEPDKARVEPVLTTKQLVAIATQPWWGLKRLPQEYVAGGEQLTSYADLSE